MRTFFFKLFGCLWISLLLLSCISKQEKQLESNTSEVEKPLEEWELVWSDEFKSDTINTENWNFQVEKAGRFNDEWQRYTDSPENAYIKDDCLVIEAKHISDKHGMDQYTSARLNTANKQYWKYGKISARVKLPEGEGLWPAFWMLGANIDENGGDTPWPQCGEIDILELYGSKNDAAIEVNAHFADSSNAHAFMGAKTYTLEKGKFSEDFHVFDLEWTPEHFKWHVDGFEVAKMPIDKTYLSEFHKPFFILFNVAVGGAFSGRPDESTVFPQRMYVDWVKVFKQQKG